jgi:hypothetical protein
MYIYDDDGRRHEIDDEIELDDDNDGDMDDFLEYARDFDYNKYENL